MIQILSVSGDISIEEIPEIEAVQEVVSSGLNQKDGKKMF